MGQHPLERLTAAATAQAGKVYEYAQTSKGGGEGPNKAQTRVTRPGSKLDTAGPLLAGLSDLQCSIVLLKYGSGGNLEWRRVWKAVRAVIDRTYREELAKHLNRMRKLKFSKPEPSLHLQNAMAAVVSAEYIQTHACQWCKGTRETWESDKRVDCPNCEGNGRCDWTVEDRSRQIGIGRTTYYRYAWLYQAGLDLLVANESAAVSHMRAKMR